MNYHPFSIKFYQRDKTLNSKVLTKEYNENSVMTLDYEGLGMSLTIGDIFFDKRTSEFYYIGFKRANDKAKQVQKVIVYKIKIDIYNEMHEYNMLTLKDFKEVKNNLFYVANVHLHDDIALLCVGVYNTHNKREKFKEIGFRKLFKSTTSRFSKEEVSLLIHVKDDATAYHFNLNSGLDNLYTEKNIFELLKDKDYTFDIVVNTSNLQINKDNYYRLRDYLGGELVDESKQFMVKGHLSDTIAITRDIFILNIDIPKSLKPLVENVQDKFKLDIYKQLLLIMNEEGELQYIYQDNRPITRDSLIPVYYLNYKRISYNQEDYFKHYIKFI